jgi:hypothetical protein
MCETFPPNQQEDCNIPRASIKVGWENRLRSIISRTVVPTRMSTAEREAQRWYERFQ